MCVHVHGIDAPVTEVASNQCDSAATEPEQEGAGYQAALRRPFEMLVPLPVSLLYFPLSLCRYAQAPAQIKEFYFQSSMITDVSQTPGGGRPVSILLPCVCFSVDQECAQTQSPHCSSEKAIKGQ